MKIAFVSPEWPDAANGIVSYVRHIGKALHELGHDVIVLTPKVKGEVGFETVVQIHEISSAQGAFARLASRLKQNLGGRVDYTRVSAECIVSTLRDIQRRAEVDVLEMEETFGVAGHVAELTDVPVVVRAHGPHFLNALYDKGGAATLDQLRLERERYAMERGAALTTPSRDVLQATRDYYKLNREAHVIPNPVVLASKNNEQWSVEHSFPDELLFVGRTDSRKGGDLVLRVFQLLARSRPQLRLHFVGPDQGFVDAPAGVSFGQYAASMLDPDMLRRVTYHGPLQPREIAVLRHRARVTLVFSRYEVFPYVCTEALSFGCPLVATRVGGIPEIVENEITGLLADPDDIVGLAKQVGRLMDSEELSARLGKQGREWCKRVLDPKAIASQSLAVYSKIASRSR